MGTEKLGFSCGNRLTGPITSNSTWFYGYNGLGARVSKQSGPTQFHYMRDGADVLSPILHDGTSRRF